MKTVVRGGQVVDGTGSPARQADILIEGDTIVAVFPGIDACEAQVIDARGKTVTPGFVDTHRHCDITPLTRPDFGEIELAQGITSVVAGNCGLSPVPSSPESRAALYAFLEPITGPVPPGMAFASYDAYKAGLEGTSLPLHMGYLAAAGAVKTAVKGFVDTPYSEGEMKKAQAYVRQAMEAGALGVSLGIMYPPEVYSTREEMARVVAPAAAYGALLTCHLRGEGDSLVASVQEAIDIAERAGLRLTISHFKATGRHNWRDQIFRAIEVIEQARAQGQEITADLYPYDGGSSTLLSLLPPALLQRGQEALFRELETEQGKALLRKALGADHPGWDNLARTIGWERILISSVTLPEHQAYSGRPVSELSGEQGQDPAGFIADLLCREQGRVGVVLRSMCQEDVDTIARLPWTALISDALYGGGKSPHPRLYGAFPKFLEEYVLQRKVLDLPIAVCKMTAMPAGRFGLRGRGLLLPGCKADLAIFDPGQLRAPATYARPRQPPLGMDRVMVGGKTAWEQGEIRGRHGCLLRR